MYSGRGWGSVRDRSAVAAFRRKSLLPRPAIDGPDVRHRRFELVASFRNLSGHTRCVDGFDPPVPGLGAQFWRVVDFRTKQDRTCRAAQDLDPIGRSRTLVAAEDRWSIADPKSSLVERPAQVNWYDIS
ncbi:hypothetical protein FOE78_05790 [Microlunatus elymi]|uniref:Uncharacterized protein n=1 Tax=Microlunatus elymi TaxID=2596828 RepID=A0A516PWE7_9ACTN|nr:hypothetical protein [Microlunatus elymi]QDP95479.1 hypothetical protein FOE78_05790 [Microlunatus elymi]